MAGKKVYTEARVAGGALVVSVLGGDAPRAWRADMTRLGSASFELEEGKDGVAVVMKAGDDAETVYAFPDRAEAVAALQAVTRALFSYEQAVAAAHAHHAPARTGPGFLGKVFRAVFWLFIIFVCFVMIKAVMTPTPAGMDAAPAGAPVPADEVFGQ